MSESSPVPAVHPRGYLLSDPKQLAYQFDIPLAAALARMFEGKTVLDLGCGPGWYVDFFRRRGIDARGVDGNPHTAEATSSACISADLSEGQWFGWRNWVLSLETGAHIPVAWQNAFVRNLAQNADRGIVLNWGSPRHAVSRNYANPRQDCNVIEELKCHGFRYDIDFTNALRNNCSCDWLRDAVMVFYRDPLNVPHLHGEYVYHIFTDIPPARPKVFMALPVAGRRIDFMAGHSFWNTATEGKLFEIAQMAGQAGAAPKNFNRHYSAALLNMGPSGVTHFSMQHGDIAILSENWLDILFQELSARDGDLISAVSPIKDGHGLTSTAIGWPDDRWNVTRRLHLREVHEKLPETFSIDDCIAAGLAEPGQELLVNDGCILADLRKRWSTSFFGGDGSLEVFFTMRDQPRFLPDGGMVVGFEPEDWFFTRQIRQHGGRIFATRKVVIEHAGEAVYTSAQPWGTWNTDEAPALQKR